jgi:hypothetical protein
VSNLLAIEALYLSSVCVLMFLLRAALGNMTQLFTVTALGHSPINRLASILKVHVGVGQGELLLHADKVDIQVLAAKGLLKLEIGYIRRSLDELLSCLLEVVKVTLIGGSLEFSPGNLSSDVRDVAAVNLPRVLAVESTMAYEEEFVRY